jgi:hypothetical protein
MAIRSNKTSSLSFDQIEQMAGDLPARMDGFRATELDVLSRVKRAKLVQSRRERARLEVKHGADHPLVAEADRRMANEHQVLVNTRMERDRVATPALARETGAWQLHGYVRTRDGLALRNANVALYPDAEGQQTALVETLSDSRGYFRLSLASGLRKEGDTGESGSLERPQAEHTDTGSGLHIHSNIDAADGQRTIADDGPQRLKNGLRINATIRERFTRQGYYVGARPNGGELTMVGKAFYPAPSMIAYRDIVVAATGQGGDACQLRTQWLGNSATRELHNLAKEKPGCRLEAMRPDHRVYFVNEAEAQRLGYDFCAHCYGRARSRR